MRAPLLLGISAFPILGFLGTVVGLSGAIENLPDAIDDKTKLGAVMDDLHVAFDTTLLGLVGAFACVIAASLLADQAETLGRRVSSPPSGP
jgi:biopolymer transport protein ExbB/TolQ